MTLFFRFEVNEKTLAFPDVYTRPVVVGISEEGKVEMEELLLAHDVSYSELLEDIEEKKEIKISHTTHIRGEGEIF